jgi:arylsulfatase A-like enzyme
MAPHDPRSMPRRFQEMYDPQAMPLPGNFQAEHRIDTGDLKIRDELLAAWPRQPEEIQRHLAEYYAMISHLDDALGRLLTEMADRHLLDNTIVVFAADNGLAVGQHGLMGKQNLYDHSVRVPLILAGPGIPKGETRNGLVYLLDLFPTLCDLAGIETPASVEGQSFAANLSNPGRPARDWLYLAYGSSIRGVTNGEHKLIEYFAPGNPEGGRATQLFDLRRDPLETVNLAAEADQRERLAEMRAQMARFRYDWGDCGHPLGRAFWEGVG